MLYVKLYSSNIFTCWKFATFLVSPNSVLWIWFKKSLSFFASFFPCLYFLSSLLCLYFLSSFLCLYYHSFFLCFYITRPGVCPPCCWGICSRRPPCWSPGRRSWGQWTNTARSRTSPDMSCCRYCSSWNANWETGTQGQIIRASNEGSRRFHKHGGGPY